MLHGVLLLDLKRCCAALPQEIVLNRSAGRVTYSGRAITVARAGAHACPGGIVLLDQSSMQQARRGHGLNCP